MPGAGQGHPCVTRTSTDREEASSAFCTLQKGKSCGQLSYRRLSALLLPCPYECLHPTTSSLRCGPDLSPSHSQGTYLVVVLRCVHWTDSGQKRGVGKVPVRTVTVYVLWSFAEVSPLTFYQLLRSKTNCISLRQIHMEILIIHTVLVNDFKECVTQALFATWKDCFPKSGIWSA